MNEYLVEITPGRELVYRTPLALRAAMRSGEITPDSRIYHRAGSRWISITEHPEYRKFLAERRPPNWLEPIPFEPAPPAPPRRERAARRSGLQAALARAGARLRERLARLTEAPEPAPEPVPPAPEPRAPRVRLSGPVERRPQAPPPAATPHPPVPPAPEEAVTPSPRRGWTFLP